MTAIENQQIKGITIRNAVVTIVSTASIVASVVTTYFGLKGDIQSLRSVQETEAKVNNLRITVLESQVTLLEKEIDMIRFSAKSQSPPGKMKDPAFVSVNEKR